VVEVDEENLDAHIERSSDFSSFFFSLRRLRIRKPSFFVVICSLSALSLSLSGFPPSPSIMGSSSKRRRGADDAASSERNKTLHSSFATAANAVAGLYSAASAAQKSASAAGARAVLVRRASSVEPRRKSEGKRA
jgi:hypothetical protein